MATFPRREHDPTMDGDPTERVLDWKLELRRVADDLDGLPPEARLAVLATVADFVSEDAGPLAA
jgi:hypothetical protein